MKKLLFLGLILLFSCKKSDDSIENRLSELTHLSGHNGISYSESYDKWSYLKNQNGNSYVYQTTFSSWTGFSCTTELKIINGEVVSRIYQEYHVDYPNNPHEIIDTYLETKNDLGTHDKGAAPMTIDELYASCASDYLVVDEENNNIYFQTEINGLMTICGFVPKGCADDCYRGITINSFDWIE